MSKILENTRIIVPTNADYDWCDGNLGGKYIKPSSAFDSTPGLWEFIDTLANTVLEDPLTPDSGQKDAGKVKVNINDQQIGYLIDKLNSLGDTIDFQVNAGDSKISFDINLKETTAEGISLLKDNKTLKKLLASDTVDIEIVGDTIKFNVIGEFDTYKVKLTEEGTADYLANKIVPGDNITITNFNDTLKISSTGGGGSGSDTYKVKVSEGDSPQYLGGKIVAGDNINIVTELSQGGQNLKINSTNKNVVFDVESFDDIVSPTLKPVQIVSTYGDIPKFGFCRANLINSCTNVGVLIEDCSGRGDVVQVARAGIIENIDTSGLIQGVTYYLSADQDSTYTTVEPAFPNLSVKLFKCIKSDPVNGIIDVVVETNPQFQTGTIAEVSSLETFTPAVMNKHNAYVQNIGGTGKFGYIGTIIIGGVNLNINLNSRMRAFLTQGTSDQNEVMFAIYRFNPTNREQLTLIANTNKFNPTYTGYINSPLANISNSISSQDILYFIMFTNTTSTQFGGFTGMATQNITPRSVIRGQGVLIEPNAEGVYMPPATLINFQGSNEALYMRVDV